MSFSKAGKSFSLIGKFCAGLTTITVVITDILSPLAPFAAYISSALILVLLVSFIASLIPPVDAKFASWFGEYWMLPIVITIAISSAMFLGAYSLGNGTENDSKGFLSSKYPLIETLQQDIGLIEKHTKEIAKNTKEIALSTKNIDHNTRDISGKLDHLKKEVSSNPRKEIANLGLAWTASAFVNSLMEGDLQVVSLFLNGGMNGTELHKGTSAILFAMQNGISGDSVEILSLLIANGFDVNTNLTDIYLMPYFSNNLAPSNYKAKNKPSGYSAYEKRFTGPLLLWETMLNMQKAPTERDLAVIRFLIENGADKSVTLSYLDYEKSIRIKHGFTLPKGHYPVLEVLNYAP